ncbi:MAG TPA: hypothetical protein VGM30_11615 [Puia sp.]|jgi:hypothetical protein
MNSRLQDGASTPVQYIHYTLRIASAMCFIGHGTFGIITKAVWCNYFGVFGVGHDLAYRIMPIVGTADILMGISLLVYPTRAILAWLVVWGIVTATLRPLSGEPFAELIERAGNFGAPLALLLLSGSGGPTLRGWFMRIDPDTGTTPDTGAYPGHRSDTSLTARPPDERTLARVRICLRIVVFLLLVGHGWLNLIEKKGLLSQYQALGFSNPARTALYAGLFEMLAAVAILIRPVRPLLMVLIVWKMASELFYPHWELFEWIERGGSYGSLLALLMVTRENVKEMIHRRLQGA